MLTCTNPSETIFKNNNENNQTVLNGIFEKPARLQHFECIPVRGVKNCHKKYESSLKFCIPLVSTVQQIVQLHDFQCQNPFLVRIALFYSLVPSLSKYCFWKLFLFKRPRHSSTIPISRIVFRSTVCPRITVPKVNACFSATTQPILVISSPNKSQLLEICCHQSPTVFL